MRELAKRTDIASPTVNQVVRGGVTFTMLQGNEMGRFVCWLNFIKDGLEIMEDLLNEVVGEVKKKPLLMWLRGEGMSTEIRGSTPHLNIFQS